MELIDRYILQVGRYLPHKNRGDIQAELRSLLIDTLEARMAGEASEEDVVALLKEFGPPEKVAASYRPESQYLVGPELFPVFRTVVGIALLVLVIVHAVLFGVAIVFSPDPLKALNIPSNFLGNAMTTLGAIVAVFYGLQYFDVRLKRPEQEWDPRQLPDLDEKETVSRGGQVFKIALGLVFLILVLFFPAYLGVVVTPGTPILTDPVINRYLPLIAAALLANLLVDILLLWRGRWEMGTRLAKLAANLFSLGVLAVLISGHNAWLAQHTTTGFFNVLGHLPTGAAPDAASTLAVAMYFVQWGLLIALIVILVETITSGWRLLRQALGWNTPPSMRPGKGK